MQFGENYDTVHVDEAWLFRLKDGRRIKLLPNADGSYTVPEAPTSTSKRYIDKVMFFAALARPHPRYANVRGGREPSDGKILMRS